MNPNAPAFVPLFAPPLPPTLPPALLSAPPLMQSSVFPPAPPPALLSVPPPTPPPDPPLLPTPTGAKKNKKNKKQQRAENVAVPPAVPAMVPVPPTPLPTPQLTLPPAPLPAPSLLPTLAGAKKDKKNKKQQRAENVAVPNPEEVTAGFKDLDEEVLHKKIATPAIMPNRLSDLDLEAARESVHKLFGDALEGAMEAYHDGNAAAHETACDKVSSIMETYRTIAGCYPYCSNTVGAGTFRFAPPAFATYLKTEGIRPEIFESVPMIIESAIEEGARASHWPALRDAVRAAARAWPDRELFLTRVGSARILCEASALGFTDSRLEHAITTLQRLVRYRRAHPLGPGEDRHTWLARFEAEGHAPDPASRDRLVHLRSFGEANRRLNYRGEEAELSFVRWNRRCIPEFIGEFIRSGGEFFDYEFAYGVGTFVSGGAEIDITSLVNEKRDRLYRANSELLLDDDALAKTAALARIYLEGGLGKLRHPRRDLLKFLDFTLNDPPPQWVEGQHRLNREIPIAKCYIERLDSLPLHVIEDIFRALPKCRASYGRELLSRFAQADVEKLDAEGVRRWLLDLIIDSADDLCDKTAISPKDFRAFLKASVRDSPGPVALARAHLRNAQKQVREGKPLYNYKVWVEPVKVSTVTATSTAQKK